VQRRYQELCDELAAEQALHAQSTSTVSCQACGPGRAAACCVHAQSLKPLLLLLLLLLTLLLLRLRTTQPLRCRWRARAQLLSSCAAKR
jgi:hypothetical protein